MRYLYLLAFVCSSLFAHGQVGHSQHIISGDHGFLPLSAFVIANDELYFVGHKYADTGEELYSVSEALLTSKKTDLAPNNTYGLTYRKFDVTYPYLTALGDTIFYAGFGYNSSGQLKFGLCKYADGGTPQLIDTLFRELTASTVTGNNIYLYDALNGDAILAYSSNTGLANRIPVTFIGAMGKGGIAVIGSELLYTNTQELRVLDLNTGIDSSLLNSSTGFLRSIEYLTLNPYDNKIYFTASLPNSGREVFVYNKGQIKPLITLSSLITHGIISNFAFRNNKIYVQAAISADSAALFEYDITNQTIQKLPGTATRFTINNSLNLITAPDGEVAIIDDHVFYARVMPTVSTTNTCKKLFSYNINNNSVYELNQIGSKPAFCDRLTVFKGSLYYIGNTERLLLEININTVNKYTPSPLSVEDINKNITCTAYPNPTGSDARIDIQLLKADAVTITLTDLMGRTLQEYHSGETSIKHSITIPMAQLPTGTYIYNISTDNGTQTTAGKLIKQ